MRIRSLALADDLERKLIEFRIDGKPLPGIAAVDNRLAYIEQLVESIRRIDYIGAIRNRDICAQRFDPKSEIFDPLRAAAHYQQESNIDESFWLAFLFVHFGKSSRTGWNLIRAIYGALNDEFVWTWEKYNTDGTAFSVWFNHRLQELIGVRKTIQFGNHRKYESLAKIDVVLASYAEWVGPARSHEAMLQRAIENVGDDPKALFGYLYKSMNAVERFGRTAKFDYLTMVAKLGLANLRAPSAYMVGATGPVDGARLLFAGTPHAKHLSAEALDGMLVALDDELGVGMQVLEDSLCNWQKSPSKFVAFRG
jgi:Alpha-glutamyl/putrescinyl thymine pyrophosphorylase clade 3